MTCFSGENRRRVRAVLCIGVLCAVMVAGLAGCDALQSVLPGSRSAREETMEIIKNLGPGWNLGNTLDAHKKGFSSDVAQDYEMLWNNPPAEAALLRAVRAAGFRTLRIPITWYPHMDAEHQVDASWMDRVKQVVDMALDEGFQVVINAHHEEWYSPYPDNIDYAAARLEALWKQVALHFADYDGRLLFEGMNEPRLVGDETEWTCGTPGARAGVNRLNQVFVDAVRASGGHNAERVLLLPTYCASIGAEVLADFTLPEDDRVAVSLHLYQPFAFTHEPDTADEWTPDSPTHTAALEAAFQAIAQYFTARNIPVVITEFGAIDKDNPGARLDWSGYLTQRAAQSGIPCFWWDNGAGEGTGCLHTFALIDRATLAWHHPDIAQRVVGAYAGEE